MALASEEKAREAADRIALALHPDRIVLFGSLAWGEPGQDSDIDLLVIVLIRPSHRIVARAPLIVPCMGWAYLLMCLSQRARKWRVPKR